MIDEFVRSSSLLLALLNPFLVIVYLTDLVQRLEAAQFRRVLIRAGLIATAVFCVFALIGEGLFSHVVQAEFASFQIFGGVVFLLVALQFVFRGPTAIEILRGESEHVAGAVAMPVLIGPGTISASVVIGRDLVPWLACLAVATAVTISLGIMLGLKALHDFAHTRSESLVQRYVEIAGRVMALYVGTVSIDMIMQGLVVWSGKF